MRGHNHLYGFQIGCDAKLRAPEKLFQIDALAKAGVYGNAAGLTNDYADTVRSYSASASSGHVAFKPGTAFYHGANVGLEFQW